MKKSVFMIVLVVLVLTSCATKIETKMVKAGAVKLPNWVVSTPDSRSTYYAWGYGKMSNQANSISYAQTEARNRIAQWVSTTVHQIVKVYESDAGPSANTDVITEFESLTVQNAKALISQAVQEDLLVVEDGGVYVLMSFPKTNLKAAMEGFVEQAVNSKNLNPESATEVKNQLTQASNFYWEQ